MRNFRTKMRGVVLIGMISAITAQSQVAKEQASMEAKIENRRYCEVDGKKLSLSANFTVSFRNKTSTAITMRQPLDVVPLVSRTLQDLQHSRYELMLYAPEDFGLVKPGDKPRENGPTSRQTNVKPGEVFTGQTMEAIFPIALTAKLSKPGALKPGIHFVQLVLDGEIQDTGTFVRITSQPIEITVDKRPKVEKCL